LITETVVEDKLYSKETAMSIQIEKQEVVAYVLKNKQYMASEESICL